MVDTLDMTFSALANTTRRAILDRLREGDASVAELAGPFSLTVRAVSKHIAVLEAAGLVTKRVDGRRRVSRIRLEPMRRVDAWLAEYRRVWEHRFDALEEQLLRGEGEGDELR